MMNLSIGLKNNGKLVVATTSFSAEFPRTPENIARLEAYLQNRPYEVRESDNPEFEKVYTFDGYFHLGHWYVEGYLCFSQEVLTTNPDPAVKSDRRPRSGKLVMTRVYYRDSRNWFRTYDGGKWLEGYSLENLPY